MTTPSTVTCFECEQTLPFSEAKPSHVEGFYEHKVNCVCHQCDGIFLFASSHVEKPLIDFIGEEIPIHLEPGCEDLPEHRLRFGSTLCRACELVNEKERADCVPGVTILSVTSCWDGPNKGKCSLNGSTFLFDTVYDRWGLRVLEAFTMTGSVREAKFRFTISDPTTVWGR